MVKLSQESIHAVVLGFSAAVIAEEDVREESVCKTSLVKKIYQDQNDATMTVL